MKHIATMKYIDVMKRVVTIKYQKWLVSALTLLLTFAGVQSSYAYYFYKGEKIYVNAATGKNSSDGDMNWAADGARLLLYVWGPDGNEWVELNKEEYKYDSDKIWIFSGVVSNSRNYTGCKLVRRNNWLHSFDGAWNTTQDMTLSNIYLWQYWDQGTASSWAGSFPERCKYYAPSVYRIPAYTSLKSDIEANGGAYDEIHVCPNSFTNEEPFSLRCPMKSDMSDYDYDKVTYHAWYKSENGTSWTSIDNRADDIFDNEGAKDILDNSLPSVTLSDPTNTIYYYLYSSNKAGRRLIKVIGDADNCDATCDITSFEVAQSAVNVDDNTFTLDGMVAFEQASGNLIVECDGHSETITSPVSPQAFSISGIAAASTDGVKKDVVARFSGNSSCTMTIEVTVPNISEAADDTVTVNILAGKTAVLEPEGAVVGNLYNWRTDGANIDGASQAYTTIAYATDNTSIYDYREYYPISGTMDDMMSNGNYQAASESVYGLGLGSESYMSDYIYWGRYDNTSSDINFYDNTTINPKVGPVGNQHPTYESNGFAVVKSAHNFFRTYAKVTPRDGSTTDFFGLFDAQTGAAGGNKRAWFANTTDTHNPQSNLKLKNGTTYVFSFWAANINNYGEMMNAARLQFKIKFTDTDGFEHLENLGDVLDLGSADFLNNIWHQRSATFKSNYDANQVEIMVMNLNTNDMVAGNDFALDDIQFHAISTVSRTVKVHDVFVVHTHQPIISAFTATPVQMGCGESSYSVDLHIEYKNQPGTLKVIDITDGGSSVVWDTALVALPGAGAGATWEEVKTIDRRVVQTIGSSDPVGKTRTYKVYFEDWTSANLTDDFIDPVIPVLTANHNNIQTAILPCDQLTYTLTVDVSYRNMSSDKIRVWVDGASYDASSLKQEKTITTGTSSIKSISFAIDNVPADSAEHMLHVECAGLGEGCFAPVTFRAPFSPKVVEPITITTPTLNCGSAETYTASVSVTTINHRNATLTAKLGSSTLSKVVTGDVTTFDFAGLPADGSTGNEVIVYFDYVHTTLSTCEKSATFTAPMLPKAALVTPITMPTVAACDDATFDLTFDLKYTYQDGELQVWVDDDKKGYTTFAASETAGVGKYLKLNKSEQTKTITLSGLPSDGGTTHKLYYKFDKSGYCNNTASPFALTAFPRSPTITNVSDPVVPTKVADCTVENYIATIEVEYQYTDGEEIVIAYTDKNGDSQTFGPVALAGSPQTIQIRKWDSETSKWVGVLDDIGKGAKSLEVYFQKSPVDFSSCHHSATYTAPSKSSINSGYVVTIDNKSTCGNRKYNLSGTITFSDDATDDLIISFPGVRDTTIAKGDCDKTGTPFTMTGLTAETADKTFIAKFKDQPDCPAASKPLEAVDVPGFDVANMSFTTPACDEITTTLKFDLSYTYQSGTKLYVWVDSGTKKEIAFEANKNNEITISGIEIPGVSADGVAHTLHVEFVGGRCPADEFTTPAAPFSGKISNIQTPSISDEECGLNTYSVSVTFDVSANSAGHKVIATCKGKSGEKVVASGTNTINISGIVRSTPDEADDVVIELYFYDNDNCDPRHSITFGENPFKPIPTFSLDPIGAKCYPATSFDVTYEHTNANKLYYKVTQGETTKKDWTEVTVDATKTFTISTSGWADGAYTVEAYVKSAVGCESATPHPTVTLTINKQPSLELASIDDACAGKSSVSTTVTLKDGATKYDYDVFKNDEVMSAQHKSGQTSSSISLSTSTWEPATYKIQVTAYSSVDCPSDPEEVSFVINPNPDIEVLTASQTICEEEDAVSYDFTITGAKTYSYSVVGTDIAETGITVPDGGSGTISFNPSELSDGYYALQVIAKSELGCTTTRTAALKISNKPTVSLTATTNICYLDPAGLDFKYTVSADAKTYYLYLWQADRSQKYGGCGNFDLPTMNEGTIHYDSFSPYGSPLSGGDYVAVMWVKNSAGCVSDSVVVPFTIYPIAGIEIYTVASMCATKPLSTVFYYIHSAKSFRYKIDGVTEWSGPQTPSTEDLKHFEFDISGLAAGNYTLKLQAYNDNCGYSNIAESPFTIYPLPTLNLDVTAAGINVCYPVSQVDIPYTSTDAKEYTYVLTGGGYNKTDTKSASASGKIEVNTDGLPAGDYALSVTAVSEHDCEIAAAQTTTIHINPRPTFTFNEGEVRDCHPSTGINVGYTSTNAKTYSYTLTLEGAGSPARTVADQDALADGTIVLNTTGLAAGTYDLVVTATSKDGCDMLASVSRKVIIQAKPTVSIESVESHCAGNASINVSYKTTDATTYYYEVLGTELKGHADAVGEGSFTIDISNLEPGNYTLRMKATAGQCESATDDEQFVIYPIPTVSFVTPAPIKEGVANVTVTLNLTDATKYDWRFIDKDGSTELESSADVPAGTTTVTLTTGALDEGTYSLFVTPKTSHCTGEEKEVHVVVNNKPTINFTAPEIVCAGTSSLSVPYSPSPDATDLYYTIKKGSETVVAEQHVDLTTTASPLPVNISNLTYGTYTLTGYVRSALERGDDSSVDFTLMAVPTENDVKQDLAFIGCEETYDATITVNIGNAAGRKIYAKYTDDGDHTLPVETSAGDPTATFHLTDLTHTDLSGKHEVKVYVDGFEDCGIIVGYDEPKLMTITEGFEVKPLPKSCGEEKFSLTGKVVANCSDRKIVVEYNDTYKTEVNASTGGSDFTIADIPAGGSVTQLKAYFQGKTCGVVESAVFAEPTKPEASIAFTPIVAPACDVTTFDLGFTLSYTYQEAGSLTVWVDDDHKSTYTSAGGDYQSLSTSAQTLSGTITGLPADGRIGQKLYYKFDGAHSCSGSIDLPVFPQTPLITGVSVTNVPLYIEGLEGTYSPTITVTYQKAVGERIVLEYFNKNDQSQLAYSTTAVSGDGSYEFTGISFDDVTMGSRTVHAYFEDSDCKTGGNHDGTYTAPTNSSITFESLTLVNTSTCETLRYNLTGKVSFVGAVVSDLVVEFDATHQYVIPQSQCVAGKALEFAINGVSESIPAEGKTLSAYFSLIPGIVAYSEPVYEPLVPSLDAEIVRVDTIFTCGSKSYTVFLNITSENQRGACFVYDSIAGGTLRRVAKHDGTYNGTDEFTIAMPQRVEKHYIIVRYPNTECVVRFAPISVNPYTKPQPVITLTPIERVCNTATELVLPFAITQGDIAEASLTLTDSKEQTIVSDAELTINATKDTLTYALHEQLSAGKHTVTVEVRDMLDCVATATLPIELALDGQIYSKWNDVLLVDNSQGLYSAYQWYENGQPLSGKTDQVLYLPDGMKGTYTCLLTTPEGKLFTCEYEFEDIPRSADQQFSDNDITVLPNRVKEGGVVAVQQSQSEMLRLILMSATGQRIGEYTQTDSKQLICMPAVQGVYLLRITSDSGMQTEKIVVY